MNDDKQIYLPRLIGEEMVLQRGECSRIWGWASPHTEVEVILQDQSQKVSAHTEGKWEVIFRDLEVGGPFNLRIRTSQIERVINEVYVGDVWVCSGQSNMELPMRRVKDKFPEEIIHCTNPNIKMFKIKESYNFKVPIENHVEAGWEACSLDTILDFSALGYFFAKYIQTEIQVPIGIINASLGGSPIEAWLPEEEIQDFPNLKEQLVHYRNLDFIKQIKRDEQDQQEWVRNLEKLDRGLERHKWYSVETSKEDWKEIQVPVFFSEVGLKDFIGSIWLNKTFDVPKEMADKKALIWLGTIVDRDETYINGQWIGSTAYQYPPRKYEVPEGLIKAGKNTLTLRITCNNGNGRLTPHKEYKLFTEEGSINLAGKWSYRIGGRTAKAPEVDFVSWKPTGLYNGMIAPCHPYSIKGVIWYQGESNTGKPEPYAKLLQKLILSWRRKWKQGDFTFLVVQLPNFDIDLREDSGWAQLREAQLQVEELPCVGTTINIDLGEDNDLHPVDKKSVAYRLSLAARALAYNEGIEWQGPRIKSIQKQGQKVILEFSHAEAGLITAGDRQIAPSFMVAGEDGIFYLASIEIYKNQVILESKSVSSPTIVRYAYCNSPKGGLLYNHYGLPMAPFERYC